jgi:hypothetical protein
MDFTIEGVKWWSLIILDGYSRTMLAGAVAPTEGSWVALMVLYTACLRYGVPQSSISDSGGAFTSNEFEQNPQSARRNNFPKRTDISVVSAPRRESFRLKLSRCCF